jgi:hypothetical protein
VEREGVPNIMHDRVRHEKATELECDDKVVRRPAIAMLEKDEVDR